MVTYPLWYSALDRRRVDHALAAHQAPVVTHEVPGRSISERKYASEAVAVQAVLAVFQIIVQVLLDHVEHQTADTLRSEAHRLFGDVIAWADTPRPASATHVTLADFVTTARAERDRQPWWQQFLETVQAPVVTTAPASTSSVVSQPAEDGPLWSISEAAKRLRTSPDTVKRMIKKQELRFVIVGKRKKIPASELKRILTEPKWLYRDKK
jgi:excisionase family DNA binding protein